MWGNYSLGRLDIFFLILYLMRGKSVALIAILACLAAVTLFSREQTHSTREIYEQWKTQHHMMLRVTPEQDEYRFKIFEQNLNEINEHNAKEGQTYKMGTNQFTGLSKQEFKETYLSSFEANPNYQTLLGHQSQIELNVDWVSYGAVSPVKNEGSCKANYAFSAVGAIEGISVILFHQQTEYSTQEVIDCSSAYGNNGCIGGNMINTFNFVLTKGINSQSAYPYVGRLQKCSTSSGFFKIKSSTSVSSCPALDAALTKQPVSVAVDGTNMVNYSGGLFSNCGTNLTLAALLVGGTDSYYRLKNSWGTGWGEAGYIRLSKFNNICGICTAASYPNA